MRCAMPSKYSTPRETYDLLLCNQDVGQSDSDSSSGLAPSSSSRTQKKNHLPVRTNSPNTISMRRVVTARLYTLFFLPFTHFRRGHTGVQSVIRASSCIRTSCAPHSFPVVNSTTMYSGVLYKFRRNERNIARRAGCDAERMPRGVQ